MTIVLILLGVGLLIAILANIKVTPEALKVDIKQYEKTKQHQINLYGELTKEIKWGYTFFGPEFPEDIRYIQLNPAKFGEGCNGIVRCFESSQIILINDSAIKFDSLVGCELIVNDIVIESTTKTATGNMIGRTAVGGILAGGIGAMVGGATAEKKSTSTSVSFYKINITLNDIRTPIYSINLFTNENEARDMNALLSLIIKRTEAGFYAQ